LSQAATTGAVTVINTSATGTAKMIAKSFSNFFILLPVGTLIAEDFKHKTKILTSNTFLVF
jgi:hypothetical protein